MRVLAERYPHYLSNFIAFPGWPGLPGATWRPAASLTFLASMQAQRYDLLLQMHSGDPAVNSLAAACGARITAGFANPGSLWRNKKWFVPYPEKGNETSKLLRLCAYLGIQAQGRHMEFTVWPSDVAELSRATPPPLPAPYIVVHPGAPGPPWPVEHFAAVADRCAHKLGMSVAIAGTTAERSNADQIAQRMQAPAYNLAGTATLGTFAALLQGARLYVGNDTDIAHLSAAVGTPSIVISTPASQKPNAPPGRRPATGHITPTTVFQQIQKTIKKELHAQTTRSNLARPR